MELFLSALLWVMPITILSDARADIVRFRVIPITALFTALCSAEFLFSLRRKRNRKANKIKIKIKMKITKEIFIEDLVRELPDAVEYLMKHGIRCLQCGEPVWGTLETAAKEKGFTPEQIDIFVNELNALQKE